jgi:uncharacterized protein (UPF0332 family)
VVTAAELFASAEQQLKEASTELEYRAVVERAYYAAYHAAASFEEKLPARSAAATGRGTTGSHDALIQRLERPSPTLDYGLSVISKEVGATLRMLKPHREHAAYDLEDPIRVDHAEATVRGAREVLAEVKRAMSKLVK